MGLNGRLPSLVIVQSDAILAITVPVTSQTVSSASGMENVIRFFWNRQKIDSGRLFERTKKRSHHDSHGKFVLLCYVLCF